MKCQDCEHEPEYGESISPDGKDWCYDCGFSRFEPKKREDDEFVENPYCICDGDCPYCDDEPDTDPCVSRRCKWYRGPGGKG